jgi:DUF4097 and DUF4098 domain-containing protein YvlB
VARHEEITEKEIFMRKTVILFVAVMLAVGVARAADVTETYDQTFPLDPNGRIALDNINGDVTVDVWDRSEVRVFAIKRASSSERLDALKIEVDASHDAVVIDTRYPNSRDLSDDDRHGHSEVVYSLTVPRFASIDDVDLVNGDLTIEGVEGGIDADTVNGAVVVRGAAGEIELETVNGGIEIELSAVGSEDVSLSSVNGTVAVMVAGSAEIRAETVNGSISNDLGFEVRKGKYVGSSMRGELGSGGRRVEIETVNGAISIGPM